MKVGIIGDVHGNPRALESVLGCLDDAEIIYNLGDMVGIGPRPWEAVEMIRKDGRIRSVMGNHCHNTVHGTQLGPTDVVPRKPHHDWVRDQLDRDQMRYLKGLPIHLEEDIEGVRISVMHRHPDDCGSRVPYFDDPTPGVLDDFYDGVEGDLILFGHTHVPLDVHGGRRYFNPGAVGVQNGGKASFGILEVENGGFDLERREVKYDSAAVADEIMERGIPYRKFIVKTFF